MNKRELIDELTSLLAISLRHKIGSLVNKEEVYAQKYARDAEILFKEAEKASLKANWNIYDKAKIKEDLKKKLKSELEKKDFLGEGKFELMDREISKAIDILGLK